MLRRSFLKAFGAASVALAVGAAQFKRHEPDIWNDHVRDAIEQTTRDLTAYINRLYCNSHGTGRLVEVDANTFTALSWPGVA